MRTLVLAVGASKEAEREASHTRKELEFALKEILRANGVHRVAGNGFSVNWSPVKGRPSWDMKGLREAAEAAGVDLSLYETTGDPTDRLTVTIKDQ